MKWSDYTSQLDTVHAPADLTQRLYAMEAEADPVDAPRFAPAKPRRLSFGHGKLWQMAAALALCVGIAAVLPTTGLFRASGPMNQAPGSFPSQEMAMDSFESGETHALQDSTADAAVVSKARSIDTRKIIYTTSLTLESTEYDTTRAALDQALAGTDGYIQQTEEYTRPGDARTLRTTYRIPAGQYQTFLQAIAQTGNLIHSNESSDDVTMQYVDTKAHVDALTTQRDRLLALQNQASDLADLLAIEDQLTQAQYELESWQAQLNVLINQTDYCTVNLELYEVKVYTPTQTSLLQRIGQAFRGALTSFGETLTGLLLWVIGCWPWLVLIGLCAWLLLRGRIRRRKKHTPADHP